MNFCTVWAIVILLHSSECDDTDNDGVMFVHYQYKISLRLGEKREHNLMCRNMKC